MHAKVGGFWSIATLALLAVVALTPHPVSAHPSMAVAPEGAREGYVGVQRRPTYVTASGALVDDVWFELPGAVVRDVSIGSVIEPDDHVSQRVVVVEPHVGYCIDYGRRTPTAATVFHFHGVHLDRIARAAAAARSRGERASHLVWAMRGSFPFDPHGSRTPPPWP